MAPHTRCSQAVGQPLLDHIQMLYDENTPQVSQTMCGSTKGPLQGMHQNGTKSIQSSPSQISELDYFREMYHLPQ